MRLAAALLVCAAACASVPAPPPANAAAVAQALSEPKLRLPRFPGGEMHDLKTDRGQVILLDVWATWCEPCRDSLPAYQELALRYADRGLKAYAISVDEDPAQVARFLQETAVQLPVLLDQDAVVAERELQVSRMPTTFLLDRQGRLRFSHEGFGEGAIEQLESELKLLLDEKGR
jgi:thiol-disulfide isomerase/thioredoxin